VGGGAEFGGKHVFSFRWGKLAIHIHTFTVINSLSRNLSTMQKKKEESNE